MITNPLCRSKSSPTEDMEKSNANLQSINLNNTLLRIVRFSAMAGTGLYSLQSIDPQIHYTLVQYFWTMDPPYKQTPGLKLDM